MGNTQTMAAGGAAGDDVEEHLKVALPASAMVVKVQSSGGTDDELAASMAHMADLLDALNVGIATEAGAARRRTGGVSGRVDDGVLLVVRTAVRLRLHVTAAALAAHRLGPAASGAHPAGSDAALLLATAAGCRAPLHLLESLLRVTSRLAHHYLHADSPRTRRSLPDVRTAVAELLVGLQDAAPLEAALARTTVRMRLALAQQEQQQQQQQPSLAPAAGAGGAGDGNRLFGVAMELCASLVGLCGGVRSLRLWLYQATEGNASALGPPPTATTLHDAGGKLSSSAADMLAVLAQHEQRAAGAGLPPRQLPPQDDAAVLEALAAVPYSAAWSEKLQALLPPAPRNPRLRVLVASYVDRVLVLPDPLSGGAGVVSRPRPSVNAHRAALAACRYALQQQLAGNRDSNATSAAMLAATFLQASLPDSPAWPKVGLRAGGGPAASAAAAGLWPEVSEHVATLVGVLVALPVTLAGGGPDVGGHVAPDDGGVDASDLVPLASAGMRYAYAATVAHLLSTLPSPTDLPPSAVSTVADGDVNAAAPPPLLPPTLQALTLSTLVAALRQCTGNVRRLGGTPVVPVPQGRPEQQRGGGQRAASQRTATAASSRAADLAAQTCSTYVETACSLSKALACALADDPGGVAPAMATAARPRVLMLMAEALEASMMSSVVLTVPGRVQEMLSSLNLVMEGMVSVTLHWLRNGKTGTWTHWGGPDAAAEAAAQVPAASAALASFWCTVQQHVAAHLSREAAAAAAPPSQTGRAAARGAAAPGPGRQQGSLVATYAVKLAAFCEGTHRLAPGLATAADRAVAESSSSTSSGFRAGQGRASTPDGIESRGGGVDGCGGAAAGSSGGDDGGDGGGGSSSAAGSGTAGSTGEGLPAAAASSASAAAAAAAGAPVDVNHVWESFSKAFAGVCLRRWVTIRMVADSLARRRPADVELLQEHQGLTCLAQLLVAVNTACRHRRVEELRAAGAGAIVLQLHGVVRALFVRHGSSAVPTVVNTLAAAGVHPPDLGSEDTAASVFQSDYCCWASAVAVVLSHLAVCGLLDGAQLQQATSLAVEVMAGANMRVIVQGFFSEGTRPGDPTAHPMVSIFSGIAVHCDEQHGAVELAKAADAIRARWQRLTNSDCPDLQQQQPDVERAAAEANDAIDAAVEAAQAFGTAAKELAAIPAGAFPPALWLQRGVAAHAALQGAASLSTAMRCVEVAAAAEAARAATAAAAASGTEVVARTSPDAAAAAGRDEGMEEAGAGGAGAGATSQCPGAGPSQLSWPRRAARHVAMHCGHYGRCCALVCMAHGDAHGAVPRPWQSEAEASPAAGGASAEASMLCGGCRAVRYCSVACQRRDYRWHAPVCRELRARAVAGGATPAAATDS